MQNISDKSRDKLWKVLDEEIMQARIKIEKLNIEDKFIKETLYKIMFDLSCAAPQAAISCFNYNKER